MARTNGNGEKVEKVLTPEEIFEQSARVVAARARDINKAVKEYRDGDADIEEMVLGVQLAQRKLAKAINSFATAHRTLVSK